MEWLERGKLQLADGESPIPNPTVLTPPSREQQDAADDDPLVSFPVNDIGDQSDDSDANSPYTSLKDMEIGTLSYSATEYPFSRAFVVVCL